MAEPKPEPASTARQFRRIPRPAPYDHGAPISRITLVPLAALAIIGLLYPIAALPAQTHALLFAMPTASSAAPPAGRHTSITQHSNGSLTWNRAAITLEQLRERLARERDSGLYVTFDPSSAASYGAVVTTLQAIARSGTSHVWICTPVDVHPGRFERRWPEREPGEHDTACSLFQPQ